MRQLRTPAMAALAVAVVSALHSARAEQAVEKGERIEVTGSRLASSDVESASPIAIIKAEELKIDGFPTLELILANWPQIYTDYGNRINNGQSGAATVGLRGLGAQRTLTLLDGHRLPPGSPAQLAPDLNTIPAALIQRIEILTGGASAVYGSDAIAGVINFILNDHFEGVQGDVAYDFYAHQQHNALVQDLLSQRNFAIPGDKWMDGATTSVDLTMGGNFAQDKGNAVVSFRYRKADALLQGDRDYSACSLAGVMDNVGNTIQGALACGGSNGSYPGRFTDVGAPKVRRWTMDSDTGVVRPFVIPGDQYNFAPLNYFQTPNELYGFSAFANYEISSNARVYGQFGYTDNDTVAQLAPTTFTVETLVRYENPQLTDEWRRRLAFMKPDGSYGTGTGTVADVIIQRRNVEGGGRLVDTHLTSFRDLIGLKGTAAQDWDYDLYFQTARTIHQESLQRDFSRQRIARALDVVADPATGRAVCASALNGTDPACVPYNVWIPNGVTPEALAYLQVPALERATLSQQIVGGTVATDLGKYSVRSPWAKKGVEIALGLERRVEKLDFEPDVTIASGDTSFTVPPGAFTGSLEIKDVFGEVRVPVLDSLDLTGSYRRSDYGAGKKTDTFGVGFNVAPVNFLRIRGSFQNAVREPDLNEMFTPQTSTDTGKFTDPCSGDHPSATLVQCQRTGVTAAQYGNIQDAPIGNIVVDGGNPDLKAEKARTYTLGLVFTPARNLSMTVDYYDLRLENAIQNVPADVSLDQCLQTGDPRFCSLVSRDPHLGTLWLPGASIVETGQNIGALTMSGVDVAINYSVKLSGSHRLLIDAMGSYWLKVDIEPFAGAAATRCAGYFGDICGNPNPKWRHRVRATWTTPWGIDAAATWRYTSSTRNVTEPPVTLPMIKYMNYLDLAVTWNVNKWLTLRGGVNNVLDADPPLAIGNANTVTQFYDVLGRHFFTSLTARF
jgi:outer membrane receptor protein involved in Fe transport